MSPPAHPPPSYRPYRPASIDLPHDTHQRLTSRTHPAPPPNHHDARPQAYGVHPQLQEDNQRPGQYGFPSFFPPPSLARASSAAPASSAIPRRPPSFALPTELDHSMMMPPSRHPDGVVDSVRAREGTSSGTSTKPGAAHPSHDSTLLPSTLAGLGPTQHLDFPSQLFSYPPSVEQPSRPGDKGYPQNQGNQHSNGTMQAAGMSQESHWSPMKKANKLQAEGAQFRDAHDIEGKIACDQHTESTIHAPKPSRAIDLQGMNNDVGRQDGASSTTPPAAAQPASQLPSRRQREQEDEEGRRMLGEGSNGEGGDSQVGTSRDEGIIAVQAPQSRERSAGGSQIHYRPTTPAQHSQAQLRPRMQAQPPYQGVIQARVDSYQPSQPPAAPYGLSQSGIPMQSRQAYDPLPTPAIQMRRHEPLRSTSTRPFAAPSIPRMTAMPDMKAPVPVSDPHVWRPATSNLGSKVRNPAELFMAAATQQQAGAGKVKTTSEKILARIDECFEALMARMSDLIAMQQQTRDQLHDLRLGQKAMATREEIVEDMVGQLTPALHESFQALTTSLARLISSIPSATADQAAEQVKGHLIQIRRDIEAEEEKDEAARKPFAKLVKHLISKLDGVSDIVTFLQGCKDLPEALRDVAVYKQSLDAMTAMTKQLSAGKSGSPAKSVDEMYTELKGSLHGIDQKLSVGHVSKSGEGRAEDLRALSEIMRRVTALNERFDQASTRLALPGSNPASHEGTAALDRKVDGLAIELASLRGLIIEHIAKPPQLDIPTIVAQLRQAIMAPAAETPTDPNNDVTGPRPGGATIGADSQAFQPTQIGPAHVPPHQLMTPMTSQRPGIHPDSAAPNAHAFTPYDWQNSGYGAMNMGIGHGLAGGSGGMDGSQFTDIAHAQGAGAIGSRAASGGSDFVNMQQSLVDYTFNFGQQAFTNQTNGFLQLRDGQHTHAGPTKQYDSNGKTISHHGNHVLREATATGQPAYGMGDHPINAFRSGQLDGPLSGAGARSTSGSAEGDVFGKVRNIPVTSSTSALPVPQISGVTVPAPIFNTGHTGSNLDPLEAQASWTPVLVPETAVDSLARADAGNEHNDTHQRMRDDDESSVDDYADIFNDPGPNQASASRTAQSGIRGTARGGLRGGSRTRGPSSGSGRGTRGQRAATNTPSATTSTPVRTPAAKRPRTELNISPNRRSSSMAPFSQVQPVAARTRRGSVLVPPATPLRGSPLISASKASRLLIPSSKGKTNIPEDPLDKFGVPRRLSDRIAQHNTSKATSAEGAAIAMPAPTKKSPSKPQSKTGGRNGSKASTGPSDSSGSPEFISATNASGTAFRSREVLEKQLSTSRNRPMRASETGNDIADNHDTSAPGRTSPQSEHQSTSLAVEDQEEKSDITQSLELPEAPQPSLVGTGNGRKAVTYAGRKRRAIDVDVDDMSSSG